MNERTEGVISLLTAHSLAQAMRKQDRPQIGVALRRFAAQPLASAQPVAWAPQPRKRVELPAPLDVTFLSSTSHRDERDVKVIVKAVDLLLSLRDAPPGVLSPPGRSDLESGRNAFSNPLDH